MKKSEPFFSIAVDELPDFDWTKDAEFLLELNQRSVDYKSGKVKGKPWDEAKEQILASSKSNFSSKY